MANSFDFDAMADLYKKDPEQFRVATHQMIHEYIASIPNEISRKKCAGIQFRIDNELNKYKDPIARFNKMVEIFWLGVEHFHEALVGDVTTVTDHRNDSENKIVYLSKFKKTGSEQ